MREDRFIGQDTVVGKYHAPNASYEMSVRDYVLRPSADANSGAITITLPGVSEARGRIYNILVREADGVNSVTIQDKDDSEAWSGDYPIVCKCQILFYSDGMSWQAIFGAFSTLSTKTIISAPEIKALNVTSIELVPALGAGISIEFVAAVLKLTAGSEVLTEAADNLAIYYDNGSGIAVSQVIETTGFIDQAVDMQTNAKTLINAIAVSTTAENKNIALINLNAAIAGNATDDAVLTVWTRFRIVNTN